MLFVKIAGSVRSCLFIKSCGKSEIHNGKRWKEHWRFFNGDWLCYNHYHTFVYNKTKKPQTNKKITEDYWRYDIAFLGKKFRLSWKIRKGFCSQCSNNTVDKSCLRTNMHHLFYIPIMVWACTQELCVSCHRDITEYVKKL